MKKVILFITLFSMISLFSYSKDPVKQWGQLQVKGNQLCSQTGDPIVLRGVSYGWHNLWPRFYNKQSVKWLKKDWKCTVLRAAMGTVIEDNFETIFARFDSNGKRTFDRLYTSVQT